MSAVNVGDQNPTLALGVGGGGESRMCSPVATKILPPTPPRPKKDGLHGRNKNPPSLPPRR